MVCYNDAIMTEMLPSELQLSPVEQSIKNLTDYTDMLQRQMAEAVANPVMSGSVHDVRYSIIPKEPTRSVRLLASYVLPEPYINKVVPTVDSVSDINDKNWFHHAECRPGNLPMDIFPSTFDSATSLAAKAICKGNAKKGIAPCPVQTECLNEALVKDIQIGIWGGMGPRERNRIKGK
jgi:hypothetical protein